MKNPYIGPRPFAAGDHNRFFGRDQEIEEITSHLYASRVLVLYAESGAGKTSLLNAGVLPELAADFNVLPVARVSGAVAQGIDTATIGNLAVHHALSAWSRKYPTVDPASMSLTEAVSAATAAEVTRPALIVFDQFEELFTGFADRAADRSGFFTQLGDCLRANPSIKVLLSLREDFLGEFNAHAAQLFIDYRHRRYRLERLREKAARQAVLDPLPHGDPPRRFDEGVVDQLVRELLQVRLAGQSQPLVGEFVEPVQLQVVCETLWDNLSPNIEVITKKHAQEFGDVTEALTAFYTSALERATRGVRGRESKIRNFFDNYLITEAGTRGTVVEGDTKTGGLPNEVIGTLEDAHVVRAEESRGARWYELTHDRLIEPVRAANHAWWARRRKRLAIAGGVLATALVITASVFTTAAVQGNTTPSGDETAVSYRGADLTGRDFSGQDLSGEDFTGADLTGANFTGATLIDAIFQDANLTNANLTDVIAIRADFTGTTIRGTTYSRADLTSASLRGAVGMTPLEGTALGGRTGDLVVAAIGFHTSFLAQVQPETAALQTDATLDCASPDAPPTDFRNAVLRGADLTEAQLAWAQLGEAQLDGATMTGSDLRCAQLAKATLSAAILVSVNLAGADLSESVLDTADLTDATLINANASGADLSDATLLRSGFDDADLGGAVLVGADLSETTLAGASLVATNLGGVDLRGVGQADLIGSDLSGARLVGANLGSLDMTGARLSGADLSEADLTATNLSEAILENALLGRAVLAGAVLRGASLDGADLRAADLTGADLVAASFNNTAIAGARLAAADLTEADMTVVRDRVLSDVDFTGAILTGATLNGMTLGGLSFAKADLSGAELRNAQLVTTSLVDANLVGADLSSASLIGADLTGANVTTALAIRADLSGADLTDATLAAADLTDARFAGAVLEGANFAAANLTRANLGSVDLTSVRLQGVSLIDANLARAGLAGTDLSGSDLSGANLAEALLTSANLSGVTLSGAILSEADLAAARLINADLRSANLISANLDNALLNSADLSGAILTLATMRDASLTNADLTLANLANSNLSGVTALDIGLEQADLTGARVIAADLTGADLSGSNLTGADFASTLLIAASFSQLAVDFDQTLNTCSAVDALPTVRTGGANFSGADLSGANLTGVDLSSTTGLGDLAILGLPAANLTNVEARSASFPYYLRSAQLEGAQLQCASFSGSDLKYADLRNADLRGADLTRIQMTDSDRSENDGSGARTRLEGARMRGVDLTDATLLGVVLDGLDMRSATLVGAELRESSLVGATLISADLTGAVLGQQSPSELDDPFGPANLSNADLTDADLEAADLGWVDFSGAVLTRAVLSDAIIDFADLATADIRYSVLDVRSDSDATYPDGLAPPSVVGNAKFTTDTTDVAADAGTIWTSPAGDGFLARDPFYLSISNSLIPAEELSIYEFQTTADAMWAIAANVPDLLLTRITNNGDVMSISLPIPDLGPYTNDKIRVVGDDVWVLANNGYIALATADVTTITLEGLDLPSRAEDITVAAGYVWVASGGEWVWSEETGGRYISQRLYRINWATKDVAIIHIDEDLEFPKPVQAVVAHDGYLWIVTEDQFSDPDGFGGIVSPVGGLYRLDLSDAANWDGTGAAPSAELVLADAHGSSIRVVDDTLWISQAAELAIIAVDPNFLTLTTRLCTVPGRLRLACGNAEDQLFLHKLVLEEDTRTLWARTSPLSAVSVFTPGLGDGRTALTRIQLAAPAEAIATP